MEELETKLHAEENGEVFDESKLDRIGSDLDKLEKALRTNKKGNDSTIECEISSDTNISDNHIKSTANEEAISRKISALGLRFLCPLKSTLSQIEIKSCIT